MQTGDGYLLGLHRLCCRKGEEGLRVNAGDGSVKKRVVYLHHGLLMNSEVWVCMTEKERCLPFKLVEKGYDVWVCHKLVELHSTHEEQTLTESSWGIIVGTSTPRNPLGSRLRPTTSGTSLWTNSPFTTSLTALTTSSPPRLNHHYPTLAFPKAPLRLSQLYQSILH